MSRKVFLLDKLGLTHKIQDRYPIFLSILEIAIGVKCKPTQNLQVLTSTKTGLTSKTGGNNFSSTIEINRNIDQKSMQTLLKVTLTFNCVYVTTFIFLTTNCR